MRDESEREGERASVNECRVDQRSSAGGEREEGDEGEVGEKNKNERSLFTAHGRLKRDRSDGRPESRERPASRVAAPPLPRWISDMPYAAGGTKLPNARQPPGRRKDLEAWKHVLEFIGPLTICSYGDVGRIYLEGGSDIAGTGD